MKALLPIGALVTLLSACSEISKDNNSANGNIPPIISELTIKDINSGKLMHWDLLEAEFTYSDNENDPADVANIRWLINGKEVASGKNFIPKFSHIGKKITLEVAPIAQSGTIQGKAISIESTEVIIENERVVFVAGPAWTGAELSSSSKNQKNHLY